MEILELQETLKVINCLKDLGTYKKDMKYSSISNQEAKGFLYKILQILI